MKTLEEYREKLKSLDAEIDKYLELGDNEKVDELVKEGKELLKVMKGMKGR